MRFTVFTPTYNRGHLLGQLFESLQKQSFKDFEWVIVDDGSTDDTENVVIEMQKSTPFFPIVYKKVHNGGKHKAWNIGVELARGELFFGCDSDDYLTDQALNIVDSIEKTIPNHLKYTFAGVCGLKGYANDSIVGETYNSSEYRDLTHLERMENNIIGDKSEVLYTDVWKKYKYYEFQGERFLTEATSLNRMAADGLKIRYFNTIIKTITYLPDGLTANSLELFVKNPKGWGVYLHQQIIYGQLRGIKKYYKLWQYYDACLVQGLVMDEIAENLQMNKYHLYIDVLIERIRRKLFRSNE